VSVACLVCAHHDRDKTNPKISRSRRSRHVRGDEQMNYHIFVTIQQG
jgi:hypothetical protein